MPKPSKGTGGAHIRSHSRSSSNSKLGANLQFTQKDLPPPKHTDKPKKSTFTHEAHAPAKVPPPFVRLNSNQRVHSKEQLAQAPHLKRPPPPPPPLQKFLNGKSKPGFTIASPSENADDDDDEWVSSESGAATPSQPDSTSDTSSETDDDPPAAVTHPTIIDQHELTRVDTARPFDFEPPRRDYSTPKPVIPLQSSNQRPPQPPMIARCPTQPELIRETSIATTAPVSRHSPRLSSKRYSRPPSTHSISSRAEQQPLRPHPLIRGQSYGHVNAILPKPAPLAPLTVIPNTEMAHSSPPNGTSHESGSSSSGHQQHHFSSSPTSMKTPASPILPDFTSSTSHRRTSFSSTGSINTIPIHTTSLTAQIPSQVYRTHDRNRTLSSSSSSAALSSLTHLPYVLSHTRPPSPTPHTISFFPPVNPQHANAMEGIHPLLPSPYLSNHMTVLARRTPIRESFDRVVRARSGR